MAVAVGFALAWMAVPTVGKRVFLLAVSTIPTVMRCMTPSATTVKKAASGRSKSPAFAGTKTAAKRGPSPNSPESPSPALPKGREFIPVVFEEVVVHSFPLRKAGMGLVGGCRCRPVGIAVGRHCASCCLRNSRNPRHVAHGDFAERDGHCRYPVDRHPDLRNHHGWLVTYDTWARAF